MTVPPGMYLSFRATLISAAMNRTTPALMTKPHTPKSGEGINGATADAAADVNIISPEKT